MRIVIVSPRETEHIHIKCIYYLILKQHQTMTQANVLAFYGTELNQSEVKAYLKKYHQAVYEKYFTTHKKDLDTFYEYRMS